MNQPFEKHQKPPQADADLESTWNEKVKKETREGPLEVSTRARMQLTSKEDKLDLSLPEIMTVRNATLILPLAPSVKITIVKDLISQEIVISREKINLRNAYNFHRVTGTCAAS